MPDRSKVMTQIKRDILVMQGGAWGEAKNLMSVKKSYCLSANNECQLDHSSEMAKKSYKD